MEEAGGFLVTNTFRNFFSIFLYFDKWCSDNMSVVPNRLQPDRHFLNQPSFHMGGSCQG